ncbi:MAG TPA: hypothetical protein VGB37_05175 [Candidatus Lokiarchaeia archaeon]
MNSKFIWTKEILIGDEIVFTNDAFVFYVEDVKIDETNKTVFLSGQQLRGWDNIISKKNLSCDLDWKVILVNRKKVDNEFLNIKLDNREKLK